MKNKKPDSTFDIYNLVKTGELVIKKSYLKSKGRLYKLLKVYPSNMRMCLNLESEIGDSITVSSNDFRKFEFELAEPKGVTYESWIDPA